MLTNHIENDKPASGKAQHGQGVIPELWQAIRPDKAISATRLLWSKVPDGWQLRTVADKRHVATVMLNELYPGLAVTVGTYEKLVDVVGVDSTLAIFNRQVKIAREEDNQSKQQK